MKLSIEKRHLAPLLIIHPQLDFLSEHLRFGNKAQVIFDQLQTDELASLAGIYEQEGEHLQPQAALLTALHSALISERPRYEGEQPTGKAVAGYCRLSSEKHHSRLVVPCVPVWPHTGLFNYAS